MTSCRRTLTYEIRVENGRDVEEKTINLNSRRSHYDTLQDAANVQRISDALNFLKLHDAITVKVERLECKSESGKLNLHDDVDPSEIYCARLCLCSSRSGVGAPDCLRFWTSSKLQKAKLPSLSSIDEVSPSCSPSVSRRSANLSSYSRLDSGYETDRVTDLSSERHSVASAASHSPFEVKFLSSTNDDSPSLHFLVNGQKVNVVRHLTNSRLIGDEGGELVCAPFKVKIPPGAVSCKICLSLSVFFSEDSVQCSREGETSHFVVIELLPHGMRFEKDVVIERQLKHHFQPGNSGCPNARFTFFYGAGLYPNEIYEYMGTLHNSSRTGVYREMTLALESNFVSLTSRSFCQICLFWTLGEFSASIALFSRRTDSLQTCLEVEAILSCSCEENLEEIETRQNKKGLTTSTGSWCFQCRTKGISCQELVISLDLDDSEVQWTLRHDRLVFSGRNLEYVVSGEGYQCLKKHGQLKRLEGRSESLCDEGIVFKFQLCLKDGTELDRDRVTLPLARELHSNLQVSLPLPPGNQYTHAGVQASKEMVATIKWSSLAVDECKANYHGGRSKFCNSGGKQKGYVGEKAEKLAYVQLPVEQTVPCEKEEERYQRSSDVSERGQRRNSSFDEKSAIPPTGIMMNSTATDIALPTSSSISYVIEYDDSALQSTEVSSASSDARPRSLSIERDRNSIGLAASRSLARVSPSDCQKFDKLNEDIRHLDPRNNWEQSKQDWNNKMIGTFRSNFPSTSHDQIPKSKHLDIVSEVGAMKWNEIGRALFDCTSGRVFDMVSHRRDSKDSEKLLVILEEWVNKEEHPHLERLLSVCARVNIDGEVQRRFQSMSEEQEILQ